MAGVKKVSGWRFEVAGWTSGKLRGSTLIETLIAMVIVCACIGISLVIYVNVVESGEEANRLRARLLAAEEAMTASLKESGNPWMRENEGEVTERDGLTIHKTIEPYNAGAGSLRVLTIKVFGKNNKLLAGRREIIY